MSDTRRYVLNKFKTTAIKKDRIIFLCGKRGSGKTTGVMDILYRHRDLTMALVMCGTEESAEQYKDYFPDSFIYGHYDEEVLKNTVKLQKRRLFEYRMGRRAKVPYICILLDDCMFERPLSGKFMRNLFMNGRHWKILLLITCQYVIDVPAGLRGQIDYAMIFKNNSPQEREKLLNIFGSPFPKDRGATFNQIMEQCTQNFGCMVIDNTATSSRLEDCVSYLKPKRRANFRIGSTAMWRFHNRRYDLEKAMLGPPDDEEDNLAGRKKGAKPKAQKQAGKRGGVDDIVVVLKGMNRRTISTS